MRKELEQTLRMLNGTWYKLGKYRVNEAAQAYDIVTLTIFDKERYGWVGVSFLALDIQNDTTNRVDVVCAALDTLAEKLK